MNVGDVKSITLVKHISDKLDQCMIQIDFDQLTIFGNYVELLEYQGKTVQYSIRPDMVDGKITNVVANLVDKYTVQTLSKVESLKLIPDAGTYRVGCNFDINELKSGDTEYGCVALLVGATQDASQHAKWVDCKMVDKRSHVFTLRIFTKYVEGDIDPYETIQAFIGHYVKFDIWSTKYGYQTNAIEYVNTDVVVAPEVDIAEVVLNGVIAEDEELRKYVEAFDMMPCLRAYVRDDVGFELVYMAAEINLIECIQNMSSEYDVRALKRAVFVSRGYLTKCNTKFSKPILNFNKLVRTSLKDDKEVLLIIDPMADEEMSSTKKVYYNIRRFVKKVIDERRGLDEEDLSSAVDKLSDAFSWML